MDPNSTPTILKRRGTFLNRYKRGRRLYEDGDKSEVMYLQAKNAKDCWKPPELEKRRKDSSPSAFKESIVMLLP